MRPNRLFHETKSPASGPFPSPGRTARASAPVARHSAAAPSSATAPTGAGTLRDAIMDLMRAQPAGAIMTAIEIAKRLGPFATICC